MSHGGPVIIQSRRAEMNMLIAAFIRLREIKRRGKFDQGMYALSGLRNVKLFRLKNTMRKIQPISWQRKRIA